MKQHRLRLNVLLMLAVCAGTCVTHAATRPVTDCGDNGGPGTLRSVVAGAASGDTIDLSGLTCNSILLGGNEIAIPVDDLSLVGPGRDVLAVDAGSASRVFNHAGAGRLALSGLTIRNGHVLAAASVARGGCILSASDVTIDRARVTGCEVIGAASTWGGGIYAGHELVLTNSELLNNSIVKQTTMDPAMTAAGGGAWAYGIVMYDSAVIGNSVVDNTDAGRGGGLFVQFSILMRDSTLEHNNASFGGGLNLFGENTSVMVNSTISSNSVSRTGAGVYLGEGGGLLTIEGSTIAINSAGGPGGGGIYGDNAHGNVFLGNSIVANNLSNEIAKADIDGYGDKTGTFSVFADSTDIVTHSELPTVIGVVTLDPELGPLVYNGGPTRTHLPAPGSPAIGGGNNSTGLLCDQRHFIRHQGPGSDIGAVEVQDGLDERLFYDGFDGCHP